MNWLDNILEKLNPAQSEIVMDYGVKHDTTSPYTIRKAYYDIDVVNRGVNLIVDAAAAITFDITDKLKDVGMVVPNKEYRLTKDRIHKLLNFKPNPYQNADVFKRELILDLLLEGNIFIYFDGMFLFHLPAQKVEVLSDSKTFIKGYKYGNTTFKVEEIIYIKENSARTIFRGDSRLTAALPAINTLKSMLDFQQNFFNNNAVPGLVLKTPNTLSRKVKDRIVQEWMQRYNPRTGGKRPAVLDGDFDIKNLGHTDFRELDFKESIDTQERKVLKTLGVPPLLLDSGNNANISPNIKLFYINTVLPIIDRLVHSLEFFFGYDIKPVTENILALRPELKDEAAYFVGLVNGGILTPNEAREALRYPKDEDEESNKLRIPANIAGSASNPSQGGKPRNEEADD
jgi:HK97 family phage portal protein